MTSVWKGVSLAAVLWIPVFRTRWWNFWGRMSVATALLTLVARRSGVRVGRVSAADVVEGVVSAGSLYLVFQGGDRLARRILPMGADEISDIYALRRAAPRPLIAALLVTLIAPAEEVFWRGFVQRRLMDRYGPVRGSAAAVGAYGAVHLLTGNLTLAAAATTAGAWWSGEYALRRRLGPVLVSHILWDLWIFLIAPTPGAGENT